MEKGDRREQEETVEEGIEIQDSEILPEHREGLNDLHSSQQLQSEGSAQNGSSELRATNKTRKLVHQNKEETNNIAMRDTIEKTEASGSHSQKCNKLALFKRIERESVARAQVAQQESVQGTPQKRSVLRKEQLDPKRNATLQQRAESSETDNIAMRDTMEKTEASGSYSQKCNKLALFERLERESVARAHVAQQKSVQGSAQKRSVLGEKQLESERNATLQQRAESSEKILNANARDSIQASDKSSNYVEQKCDGNVHFDASSLLHRKSETLTKRFVLSSKSDCTCIVSEENEEVKGQRIVKHQSNIAAEVSSEGVRNEGTSVETQQLLKLVSDFFSQRQSFGNCKEKEPLKLRDMTTTGESESNLITLDQQEIKTDYHSQSEVRVRTISSNSIDNSSARHLETKEDTKLKYMSSLVNEIYRHKSKFERIQSEEWDRNNTSDAGAAPKERSETPTNSVISSSKLKQACNVLEENVEVKGQQIVTHQTNIEPGSSLTIMTQTASEEVETSVREQQLLKVMSVFFKQKQMEISPQENKHTSASSDEIEPRKLGDKTTSGESTDKQNDCLRDLEKNMIDCQDLADGHQNPKFESRGLPSDSQKETVQTPKTKDYVTAPPRESDATARLRNPTDLQTSIPHTSNDCKSPSQWKNYVTVHSSDQKENVRMPPRPLPETIRRVSKIVEPIPGIERFQKNPTRVFWPMKHSDETAQQLEEEKRNILFPNRYGTCSNQAEDSLLLVPFQERPENTVETGVQRHGGISAALLHPLQTGIRSCIQRIREHHMSSERCCFCEKLKSGCIILFCSVIIGSVIAVVVYFVIVFSM